MVSDQGGATLDIGTVLADLLRKLKEGILNLSNNDSNGGNIIGVDIGAERLKVLKINQQGDHYSIEKFAIVPLPPGVLVKEEIKNIPQLADTLEKLFYDADISEKEIALSIPKPLAIIKTISVDSRLTEKEIEDRAWTEAHRHFPDLIGNIYLDFSIAGPDLQDPKKSELVLVASRKDHVDPYLQVIRQAGLKTRLIDIDCYVYERVLNEVNSEESTLSTIGLMNIDINSLTFIVVKDHRLIHAHDHAFDQSKLLSQIKSYLSEHYPDKVDEQLLVNDENYNTLLRSNLLSHLRHVIHFFYSSKPNIAIQKVFLSGELASIPNLTNFLQKEIGVETAVINPIKDVTVNSTVDAQKLNQYLNELTLCFGLAISQRKGKF